MRRVPRRSPQAPPPPMPELPEVETMRRGIAHLAGRTISGVAFPRGRVRPIRVVPRPELVAARLAGGRIAAVERYGKRVAIAIDAAEGSGAAGRRWLVIEPRMTGLLLVSDPPSSEHVRVRIDFEPRRGRPPEGLTFWDQRGLGTVRLVDAAGLARACGDAVGPDGLSIGGDALHERLSRSRRAIKVALLDQRAVAGIGNIYAAEILHRCGIHPRTPCRRLRRPTWDRLAATARGLLAEAVRLEGSSIGDELYRTPTSRLGRFQRRHRVYGLAGTACRACGTTIERIVQAQRSTFFCPCCQPRSAR